MSSVAAKVLTKKRRLCAQDWIELALTEIETVGVKGLRVNTLCERSGITKGSFYSHFNDKDDLLRRVIEYWSVEQPKIILARLDAYQGTGLEKLDYFTELAHEMNIGRRDMAIREWARFDENVAAALKKVDMGTAKLIEKYLRQANPEMQSNNAEQLARLIFVAGVGARTAPWVGKDLRWAEVRSVFAS